MGLSETLDAANQLFREVKMTREAALDSQLLAAASRMATKQAQRLTTQFTVYDPVTFAQKAKTLMGGRTDDSVRGSGSNASGPSRRLPTVVICDQTAMTHNLPSLHQGAPSGKQGAGAFHRIIWPLPTSLLTFAVPISCDRCT